MTGFLFCFYRLYLYFHFLISTNIIDDAEVDANKPLLRLLIAIASHPLGLIT